ncbi:unknown [Clostridium sp. CAG:75]|nr:unknown [Clostridium sp. CAG:75]
MKVKFIFIGVVCMICLGAGILCRDTISHSIFKSGTRMSAWDNRTMNGKLDYKKLQEYI